MTFSSIGDLSRQFVSLRQGTALKTRLASLTHELSTGVKSDLAVHLGAGQTQLAALDRGLARIDGFAAAARDTGLRLGAMQTALGAVDAARQDLTGQLLSVTSGAGAEARDQARKAAAEMFDTVVDRLNGSFAGRSLFAGTDEDGPALAPAADLRSALDAALAGATGLADIEARIDTFFDDPAGGFATAGYLGDTGAPATRRIDDGQGVTLAARADAPALREVLKGAALAMTTPPGGPEIAVATLEQAGLVLASAAPGLAALQADLGRAEAQVAETAAALSARRTDFSQRRNDLTGADPYDTAARLQQVQLQLETHYTVTARLSRLSLAAYL